MTDELEKTIKAAKDLGVSEILPQLYNDLMHPVAHELGSGLEVIGKTVNVVLSPLKGLVWGYDRIEEYLKQSLAEKLKRRGTKKLTTPPPNVAIPLIEALRYSATEDEIRELFANLLATAIDAETTNLAHPAYTEIIKQLTSDEAKVLHSLNDYSNHYGLNPNVLPSLRLYSIEPNGLRIEVIHHLTFLHCFIESSKLTLNHPEKIQAYIENLIRLGILNFDVERGFGVSDSDVLYQHLMKHNTYKEGLAYIISNDHSKPEVVREVLLITEFGRNLITACLGE